MSGSAHKQSSPPRRRAGPVRALALAQKDATQRDSNASSSSNTAWLKGAHEAIALHPQWLQLQGRLHELVTTAVRQHLGDEGHPHPHTVEATRQITGELFANGMMSIVPGIPSPHLLDEPYMSAPGAADLLSQTLADVAGGVDKEAEAQGTLKSAEFQEFRALVQSVYVGSLQKRADVVEESRVGVRGDGNRVPGTTNNDSSGIPREEAVRQHGRSNTTNNNNDDDDDNNNNGRAGIAPANHQACSGDIAQALVAVAKGEGFEMFSQGSSDLVKSEGTTLVHLSENAAATKGGLTKLRDAEIQGGAERRSARFPGLEWLAPHVIGRSIPMTLRRELWQRTLGEGGASAAEVGRLVDRLAKEKGIVDPTNTPIAGMVATGVRHRVAEAFPWLAHGGNSDLELRQRVCLEANQLLNQYFVFVGRHEARHVSMSLVLAYVFNQAVGVSTGTAKAGAGGNKGGDFTSSLDARGGTNSAGASANLVAMLHSLSTRFAPGMGDLRDGLKSRAYEEIRRRDAPLFEHLSAVFPGYQNRGNGAEHIDDDARKERGTGKASGVGALACPRGLVETWLEDALVGYLREDALLFVWDHLFLLGWQEQLPLFVADIALHLRATLIRATAPLLLLSLARDACRRICTRDVRDAFRRREVG